MIYVYLVLIGLVAGGITVSGYRLVTNHQPSFHARPETAIGAFGQVLVLVFGGPLVLMRNAIRGRLIERRPMGFLVATTVIASCSSPIFSASSPDSLPSRAPGA
jgi:hypothetical protein